MEEKPEEKNTTENPGLFFADFKMPNCKDTGNPKDYSDYTTADTKIEIHFLENNEKFSLDKEKTELIGLLKQFENVYKNCKTGKANFSFLTGKDGAIDKITEYISSTRQLIKNHHYSPLRCKLTNVFLKSILYIKEILIEIIQNDCNAVLSELSARINKLSDEDKISRIQTNTNAAHEKLNELIELIDDTHEKLIKYLSEHTEDEINNIFNGIRINGIVSGLTKTLKNIAEPKNADNKNKDSIEESPDNKNMDSEKSVQSIISGITKVIQDIQQTPQSPKSPQSPPLPKPPQSPQPIQNIVSGITGVIQNIQQQQQMINVVPPPPPHPVQSIVPGITKVIEQISTNTSTGTVGSNDKYIVSLGEYNGTEFTVSVYEELDDPTKLSTTTEIGKIPTDKPQYRFFITVGKINEKTKGVMAMGNNKDELIQNAMNIWEEKQLKDIQYIGNGDIANMAEKIQSSSPPTPAGEPVSGVVKSLTGVMGQMNSSTPAASSPKTSPPAGEPVSGVVKSLTDVMGKLNTTTASSPKTSPIITSAASLQAGEPVSGIVKGLTDIMGKLNTGTASSSPPTPAGEPVSGIVKGLTDVMGQINSGTASSAAPSPNITSAAPSPRSSSPVEPITGVIEGLTNIMGQLKTASSVETPTSPEKNVGIENFGNTCWLNAGIQMLYSVPEFKTKVLDIDKFEYDANYLNTYKNKKTSDNCRVNPLNQVTKQFFEIWKKNKISILQSIFKDLDENNGFIEIKNYTDELNKIFRPTKSCNIGTEQCDCQEAINIFLDEEINSKGSSFRYTELSKRTYEQNICSITYELGLMVSIQVPETPDTIQKLYENYTTPETLEDNSTIQKSVIDTSKYLIVHLKRTKINTKTQQNEKISTDIDIKELKVDNKTFKINGAVLHSGKNMNGGHYVFAKYDKGEIKTVINDKTVITDTLDSYKNSFQPYVLLYKEQKIE